jgi:hypothetical protein
LLCLPSYSMWLPQRHHLAAIAGLLQHRAASAHCFQAVQLDDLKRCHECIAVWLGCRALVGRSSPVHRRDERLRLQLQAPGARARQLDELLNCDDQQVPGCSKRGVTSPSSMRLVGAVIWSQSGQ